MKYISYPSSMSGMIRSGPEIKNTSPLSYLSVVANIVLCAAGPRNAIMDCTLWINAYTDPETR